MWLSDQRRRGKARRRGVGRGYGGRALRHHRGPEATLLRHDHRCQPGRYRRQVTQNPPDVSDPFIAEVLTGTSTYGMLHVPPYLTIGGDAKTIEGPQPVKTIPSHFSPVNLASERDIELVFGKEDKQRFYIGNPLDMETKLCLNLEEFVKRSNGIFGKSGTGKTFLTRILLIGMLQKSKAVNLIFDMHNEYGWEGSSEGAGGKVKGLKQLFPSKVAVFTLDEENSRPRGASTDFVVKIGYDEIEPEDISLLRQTLNLTDLAVEAAYQLRRRFGQNWIRKHRWKREMTKPKNPDRLTNIHPRKHLPEPEARPGHHRAAAVHRAAELASDAVEAILDHLDRGINVVLEFGRYRDITAYILVANLLTRRIYAQYQERTEKAMANDTPKPQPLVITIEEAHKFLNPEVAGQTIFGTIAREMRKYNVTPARHRPAPQRHRRRGDVPARHQDNLPAGQRKGHRQRAGRRLRQERAEIGAGPAGAQAAGAHLRPRRADAGGLPAARVRLRQVLQKVWNHRRRRHQEAERKRCRGPVRRRIALQNMDSRLTGSTDSRHGVDIRRICGESILC